MYVITRVISGRKEWFSGDGTRNFWQFHGSYWENLFNSKYFKLFTTSQEGYQYINEVVKFQYLDNCAYAIEEVKMDHPLYVITKTPTKSVKAKDKVTDMEIAEGKQYLSRNTSGANYWEKHFSGEYTRKFPDKNKANEKAQQIRAHTVIGHYTIKVEEIK